MHAVRERRRVCLDRRGLSDRGFAGAKARIAQTIDA
jgi:hypothetical protein